jgi:lysophospholipase L1-like esterase
VVLLSLPFLLEEAISVIPLLTLDMQALTCIATVCALLVLPVSGKLGDLSCNASDVDHSKTVVVAVGDSITKGFACTGHGSWASGYVKILQDILGDDKYDVRDCSVSGTTAVQNKHGNNPKYNPSYWTSKDHKPSLKINADVVIFMLGTNDAGEWYSVNKTTHNTSRYFQRDWMDLITQYQNGTASPRVVTMIPPPFMNYSACPTGDLTKPDACAGTNQSCVINCVLPVLVPELTLALGLEAPVDLLTAFGGPSHTNHTLIPSLHPSCGGYAFMGEYIARTVFGVGASEEGQSAQRLS